MSENQSRLIVEATRMKNLTVLQFLLAQFGSDETCRLTIQRAAYEVIVFFVRQREFQELEGREAELQTLCGPYYGAARYFWHGALARE